MSDSVASLYGGPAGQRVRTRHLLLAKERGEKWAMLTSYDQYTARIFDEAGIPVLLVGDSAANNVFGYETTLPGDRRRASPPGARRRQRHQAQPSSSATCPSAPTRRARPRPSAPRCAS